MERFSHLFVRRYFIFYLIGFCILYGGFNLWYNVNKRQQYSSHENVFEVLQSTNVTTNSSSVIIHWSKLKNNLSCHYSLENDALIPVDIPDFSTGNNSIFFHETSCRGGINSRQACAIESAARLHPNWQINLLFSSPVTEEILNTSNLAKLRELQNVKYFRLHIEKYGQGTVVEDILKNQLKKSTHLMEHTSDIIRILTLHKYGGVYLDTDSILIKNLEALPPNWIGKESGEEIASGAIAFAKDGFGGNFTTAILTEIRDTFIPDSWSYNGPQAIKRVVLQLCPNEFKANVDCGELKIFPPGVFYPVHYSQRKKYFENGNLSNMDQPYMHHMWNYLTKDLKIETDSPYAKLARQYCPSIYEMYGEEFGE